MEIARPYTRRVVSTQHNRSVQHEQPEANQPPVRKQRALACLLTRSITAVRDFQFPGGDNGRGTAFHTVSG